MPASSHLPELCEGDYPFFDDTQSLYEDADLISPDLKSPAAEDSKTYTTLQPARPQQYRAMTEAHALIKSPFLSGGNDDCDLLSWKTKHPKVWSPSEVLDWMYFFAEHERVDCQKLHGENFRTINGPTLCRMSREEFTQLEPEYGSRIYDLFRQVLANAEFVAPKDLSNMSQDYLTDCAADVPSSTSFYKCPRDHEHSAFCGTDSLLLQDKTTTVTIGDHVYDIDLDIQGLPPFLSSCISTFPSTTSSHFSCSTDGGYETGSDADSSGYEADINCSEVFERNYQMHMPMDMSVNQEELNNFLHGLMPTDSKSTSAATIEKPKKRPPGRPKKINVPLDLTNTTEPYTVARKRGGTGSKGNHLWEFIRDTLKNPLFNPKLLKWENHSEGVFKFVNSEAVARMWGQKKNNKAMTYEKLSRAMRFCRSAGYFTDVPKNGKYPKKLCFKFGPKAHGWE